MYIACDVIIIHSFRSIAIRYIIIGLSIVLIFYIAVVCVHETLLYYSYF